MKINFLLSNLPSGLNKSALILSLVLLFIVSIFSCGKDTMERNSENQFGYTPPDYPEKPAGRYLKSIYLNDLGMGTAGTKVEFEYDEKNYVQSYLLRAFDHNDITGFVWLEYDINGNAKKIRLLTHDSTLKQYDNIEYDLEGRFTKISTYQKSDGNENFELSYFSEFMYPSVDTIVEYHYIRYNNFEMPHKSLFLLDSSGNVFRKMNFRFEEKYPYSERENYFTKRQRINEHHDLPKYYLSIYGISMEMVLSSNTLTGFQSFTYEQDSIKVPLGEPSIMPFEYDEKWFPISQDGVYFFYYTDFE